MIEREGAPLDHTIDGPRKVPSDWAARIWIDGIGEAERRLEVTPAIAGWKMLSFRSYTFRAGQVIEGESATDEMVMVLLSGSHTLDVAGPAGRWSWECRGRASVFAGSPYALYLPPGYTYTMTVQRDANCAYGRAPAAGRRPPRLIRPDEIIATRDHDGARVSQIVTAAVAEHLLGTETIIAPGGRSSLPAPAAAGEPAIELVSYFRGNPDTGAAAQLPAAVEVGPDQELPIEHGDAVINRRRPGPVVSASDTELYCLSFTIFG